MRSTRRELFRTTAGAMAAGVGASLIPKRPNILLIYTDDQALSHVSALGGRFPTPNIDRIFNEGVSYRRAYVTSPVCTPSRYSMLTGQYASRSPRFRHDRIDSLMWNTHLEADIPTLGNVLQSAGYRTGFIGKWHLNGVATNLSPLPEGTTLDDHKALEGLRQTQLQMCAEVGQTYGFDTVDRFYANNISVMTRTYNWPPELETQNMEWQTEGALEFIDQASTQPFFLCFATTLPHAPFRDKASLSDRRATPYGMLDKPSNILPSIESIEDRVRAAGLEAEGFWPYDLMYLDDGIGAILDKLDERGIADDTIVILMSDHQVDGKLTLYDGGGRVPLVVRWPGVTLAGKTSDSLVANIDLMPTLAAIAGADAPACDGIDIRETFSASSPKLRDHLYLEIAYTRGLVTDSGLKRISRRFPAETQALAESGVKIGNRGTRYEEGVGYPGPSVYPSYFDLDQLYDLNTDPGEQMNIFSQGDRRTTDILRSYLANLGHQFGDLTA